MALLGAMYFMDRTEYAQLAQEAAAELSTLNAIHGPRIMIKGVSASSHGFASRDRIARRGCRR